MNQLSGSKLIVIEGLNPGTIYEITKDETIIGRGAETDFQIESQVISRQHARIFAQDNRIILEDLGSSNGTYLNSVQIFGEATLESGDLITLGQEIILEFSGVPSMAEATRIEVPDSVPEVAPDQKLVVTIAGSPPVTHQLTSDQITIGRSEDNDIVIPSPVISRLHARLEKVGNSYQLVHLSSATNPFMHKGQTIADRTVLNNLDELEINSEIPNTAVKIAFHSTSSVAATVVGSAPAPPQASPSDGVVHTMLDSDFDFGAESFTSPAELTITVAGSQPTTYRLDKPIYTIGRDPSNDIVVSSPIVSRHHGQLELRDQRYELMTSPNATNAFLFEGRPVTTHRFHHNDILRIESELPGTMVTMSFVSPSEESATVDFRTISFDEKNSLTFGRDPSNDIVVDVPTVSHYHAQVERIGRRFRITDLKSVNGTFVNDQRIEGDVWLSSGDSIRIGQYRFVAGEDQFAQYDESGGLKVEALGLNKWVRKDLNILKDISLSFQPRDFIVVVGQSGGGKSTLLDAIAGYRPATQGQVAVNGIDVYRNFDAIRNEIGYVPQKDIIHMELTVYQALNYAARLRMPKDTTKAERHKRIMEVLDDLDLSHRKDVQISGLSGGQQKRVSIGVELLTKPGLFFLDEPTSGLDPGTETAFMHLMRRLADQGRTIILVTHATKNVMLADKVVFLSRGGYLSWFGPPDEALQYFDQFRTERERRTKQMEFDQIYSVLDDPSKGSPEQWDERYQTHQAYQKHIVQPLQASQQQAAAKKPVQAKKTAKKARGQKVSSLRQFFILSARNLKILTRDRSSLVLMLVAAPLVAMLDLIIAPLMGSSPFDYSDGDAANASITLFLMTIYCLLVAGLSQMREFVKEADIYKRERLVNLKIIPYVASKIWVAALLAFYHAIAYAVIHYIAFDMPGGTTEFILIYITLILAAFSGMVCGLLASALAPAASSAPMIMIMLLVPQIVLSGALAPVPSYASAPASTRWAFEGFIGITGIGSDVAADPCWKLEPEVRDAMTLDDKEAQGCKCMGLAVFDPESCNFPGIGEYYTAEIDQDEPEGEPTEPDPLREKPPEPEIPPAPEEPENQNDTVAMTQYMNSISLYQDEVNRIQDGYRAEMAIYEAEADLYKSEMLAYQDDMTSYQEDFAEYNIARTSAVGGAEGLIDSMNDEFGWAWVNKENSGEFQSWMLNAWLAQFVIIGVYVIVILYLIKRKDVI